MFSLGNRLQMECLWFCFSDLIQRESDEMVEMSNTHHIRGSWHHTVSGIPSELYFFRIDFWLKIINSQFRNRKLMKCTIISTKAMLQMILKMYIKLMLHTFLKFWKFCGLQIGVMLCSFIIRLLTAADPVT